MENWENPEINEAAEWAPGFDDFTAYRCEKCGERFTGWNAWKQAKKHERACQGILDGSSGVMPELTPGLS